MPFRTASIMAFYVENIEVRLILLGKDLLEYLLSAEKNKR